ncbi:MAG: hypothetical protein ACKOWH_01935 [Rhodoluna sp.]
MSSIENWLKRQVAGISPWVPLFSFVAAFQAMRGAYFDAIYFSFIVFVLILNWKGWFPFELPKRPELSLTRLLIFCLGASGALLFVPRHSSLEVGLMIALLLIAISSVWYRDAGPLPSRSAALTRSKWLWIALAVAISLWELFAYILSDVAQDDFAYPTISVLMDPFMDSPLGRAFFLVLWLSIGIGLIRIRQRK